MQLLRSLKDEDSEKEQAIWSTTWLNVTTFLLFKSLLESAVLFLTVSLLVRRSNPEIKLVYVYKLCLLNILNSLAGIVPFH